MCLGPEIAAALPYIASAAGAGISAIGQRNALKEQDREAARGIRRNAEFGRQGSQRVGQEIQKVAAADPQAERDAANAEFVTALRNAQMADGGDSFDQVGKTSGKFAEDVSGARAAAGAEGASTARTLARIDAPARMRVREGAGFNNAATDLSLLAGQAQGQDFLSRLRASMIQPKGQEIGGFLSGLGSTLATRAPGVKPVKQPTIFDRLPPQASPGPFGGLS